MTSCKAIMIASPGSRQGKTLLTATLARRAVNQGYRVQVFKMGPDYLDPTILEQASKNTVYNLDLWMMGESHCRQLLYQAAKHHDIILVESLMGLHDHHPSSAHLAALFRLPVLLVINVAKLAQTSAAIVHGLKNNPGSHPQPTIYGVIGNCVGSDNHHRLLHDSITSVSHYIGSIRRDDSMHLPQRHLGLVQGREIDDLDNRLNHAARWLDRCHIDLALPTVRFTGAPSIADPAKPLAGTTIAVAKDAAFGFIYAENIETLNRLGASCLYFSPLNNEPVPPCDALWLPGGYPELHLPRLTQHRQTQASIKQHCMDDKPVLAECGGMMYLGRSIRDLSGSVWKMCDAFEFDCQLHNRFQRVGLQRLATECGTIKGHSFHHSSLRTRMKPTYHAQTQDGQTGENIYVRGNTHLSYLHYYFRSNPQFISTLFNPASTADARSPRMSQGGDDD